MLSEGRQGNGGTLRGAQHKVVRGREAGYVWRRGGREWLGVAGDEEAGWAQFTKVCLIEPSTWPSN